MVDKELVKKDKRFYESFAKRTQNNILVALLKGISFLPFWVIYGLSDFMYIILKGVVKYRKNVIVENLTHAFPDKNEQEIKQITNKFYRHFCDFSLETIKMYSMSEKQLDKRFSVRDMDKMNQIAKEGKSVITLGMHYSNWEWASSIQSKALHKILMVYNPMRGNQAMERFLLHSREKWGGESVQVHKSARVLFEYIKKGEPGALWLAADQTPPANSPFWAMFLNREAPFFNGPEKLAKKTNQPVVFIYVRKVKRGYYEAIPSVLIEDPSKLESKEIMLRYIQKMEEVIHAEPEYYLWSHRRWKHTRPEGISLIE
ncbi:lysophospholipid acyltransferase family protein [uncultured Draconibacterium sp.]|uniref:lysophospholipid acyltransferase family protein n=1 Tax=uncultured Draconibacterium sp. TaxID=1573823 RepID=UPI003217BFC4